MHFMFCKQLVPESDAVKFFKSIDMDKIYKKNGLIEGFFNRPITITGKFESNYYYRYYTETKINHFLVDL